MFKKLLLTAVLLLVPTSALAQSYTVKSGDTMWKIANTHYVSLGDLLKSNPYLKDPNAIKVGQKITIPEKGTDSVYKVKKGDTLYKIALKHDVTVDALLKANPKIVNKNKINIGQSINIPAKTTKPSTKPTTPAKPTAPTADNQSFENQVVTLVNQERAKAGLKPLKHNAELSKVARLKSEDMKKLNRMSHDGTYGSPFDMMKHFGITYKSAGENIAQGQRTPQEVMKAWMNSSGHRANILSKSFTDIGVGYVKDGNYWTQQFIGK